MARSSSRHKREVQGKDSAGQTAPDFGEKTNFGVPPVWTTVTPFSVPSASLPANYDVSGFVTSDYGPLRDWSITSDDNVNITIDQSGVITAAVGTAVAVHPCNVMVANDAGVSSSGVFNFEVTV